PVARVPFCAISASQSTEMRSSAGPFAPSFQAGGGLGKRRQRLTHDGGTRMDLRALHANKNGHLGGRPCIARSLRNRQGPGRRRSSATPSATLSPTEVATETGCNAIVLLEPPMRTLAPRPAATVTGPVRPKYSPAREAGPSG